MRLNWLDLILDHGPMGEAVRGRTPSTIKRGDLWIYSQFSQSGQDEDKRPMNMPHILWRLQRPS